MAKGNVILGTLTGSVGDVTFFRRNGNQISRARVRQISNPKTTKQTLQRVILATASHAYSALRELGNQMYQGVGAGAPNQSRFLKLNMDALRRAAIAEIQGQSLYYNFAETTYNGLVVNPYKIATGSLPGVLFTDTVVLPGLDGLPATATYADVVAALGCRAGDALIFAALGAPKDGLDYAGSAALRAARVVLRPADGDMLKAFLAADGSINDPSLLNEGVVQFEISEGALTGFLVRVEDVVIDPTAPGNTVGAFAVVQSRWTGTQYEYSNVNFAVNYESPIAQGIGITDIIDAAESQVYQDNDAYYNNAIAEGGGSELIVPESVDDFRAVAVYAVGGATVPTPVSPVDGVYNVSPSPGVLMSLEPEGYDLPEGATTQVTQQGSQWLVTILNMPLGLQQVNMRLPGYKSVRLTFNVEE